MTPAPTLEHAARLDAQDPLAHCRERFTLPPGVIYLDGNSLGALPRSVLARVARAVEHEWGVGLIRSWNEADWYPAPQRVGGRIAPLIGAHADEVIVADSTSINLFKVLAAALRMRAGRRRILGERGNFPTDAYVASRDELIDGAVAVAAAFFRAGGAVAGSLAVFGPAVRIDAARATKFGQLLAREAQQLSEALGWKPVGTVPALPVA